MRVVLLGFVNREQGLIVPKGNPKGIHAWRICYAKTWSLSIASAARAPVCCLTMR